METPGLSVELESDFWGRTPASYPTAVSGRSPHDMGWDVLNISLEQEELRELSSAATGPPRSGQSQKRAHGVQMCSCTSWCTRFPYQQSRTNCAQTNPTQFLSAVVTTRGSLHTGVHTLHGQLQSKRRWVGNTPAICWPQC